MLFNSIEFLIFFPIVVILYYALPHKYRWVLLLLSSCYFYMVFIPVYILILGFTIVIDYFAGIIIENSEGPRRKMMLVVSILANTGVLAVFKYYNFLNANLSVLLHGISINNPIPYLSILLPIGLSFHTFQAMSYTIEVYRHNQKAERHFGIYALYVMFFPQLVAGPIERPQNMLHQFHNKLTFSYQNFSSGFKLMICGFFMKIVVADRAAIYVDSVYNNVYHHEGLTFIAATILFAFQIYSDFAGYSLIAIGSAKILGLNLMTNFNRPYFAASVGDFWKRWHISLSTWFRDYLYIPLGGNRVRKSRWLINIFITFLVSGLWHGANWTFVIWGSLNGLYLIMEALLFKEQKKGLLHIFITFLLINFSWIFFRANNIHEAFYIVKTIFTIPGKIFIPSGADVVSPIYAVLTILLLLIIETKKEYFDTLFTLRDNKYEVVRLAYYAGMIFLILYIGVFGASQFIYFQF
jgi:alginate O-acetyltransferase complex protein AlgI